MLSTSRVTDDPIAAWDEHNRDLFDRCAYLNSLGIEKLYYTASNGTDFTVGMIPEAEFKGGGDDALTVSAVGRSLTPVLIGEVSPKYFDSGKSDVGNAVLVDNLDAITEYNRSLSTYNEYIRKGQQAVSQKRFHEALAFYGSADALGKSMYSMIVSIMRQIVVLVPAAWLLSLIGNVNYVWWAFPIAELMSAATTLVLFSRIYKKVISRIEP